MTKTLEQIQEENRKAIILANNLEANDYEAALEMEQHDMDCVYVYHVRCSYSGEMEYRTLRGDAKIYGYKDDCYVQKIIGKPLTLDRVLIALNKTLEKDINWEFSSIGNKFFIGTNNYNLSILFKDWIKERPYWDLTKPTLEEQTEDCQREINKLII